MKVTLNRRQFLETSATGLVGAAIPFDPSLSEAGNKAPTQPVNNNDISKVAIRVDAASDQGALTHAWAFFGHDEANYSYTEHGKKLLADLNALSPVAVQMRAHHLFTSGDPATTALKWSPTNVYTEDPQGTPVYDWQTLDKLFDNYLAHGIKPLVELGFMPQDLSTKKEPYQYVWGGEAHIKEHGWTYPPKDYEKWAALVTAFIEHFKQKYGQAELESWYWEVWNEPDIFFWQGTTQEYLKLYDYTAEAVKKALPQARLGGPTSTAPKSEKSATFLREFLQHCSQKKNFVTGQTGSPLDYISFHTKGAPELAEGHVRMGMQAQLARADWAFRIIAEFPEFKDTPIIIGESDPEGTAAYNVADRPENVYRQGPIYPAYTACVYKKLQENAQKYGLRLIGNLTWAFQFEDQPYFAGFRELATNGINKAVLNGFRLMGLMTGHRLAVKSEGAVALEEALATGIRGQPDVNAMAAASDDVLTVLVWNYHDEDVSAPVTHAKITINALPDAASDMLLEHYRVDEHHSNVYAVWQAMGSPQNPSAQQLRQLQEASELRQFASPQWVKASGGQLTVDVPMPRYSLSLLKLSW